MFVMAHDFVIVDIHLARHPDSTNCVAAVVERLRLCLSGGYEMPSRGRPWGRERRVYNVSGRWATVGQRSGNGEATGGRNPYLTTAPSYKGLSIWHTPIG